MVCLSSSNEDMNAVFFNEWHEMNLSELKSSLRLRLLVLFLETGGRFFATNGVQFSCAYAAAAIAHILIFAPGT